MAQLLVRHRIDWRHVVHLNILNPVELKDSSYSRTTYQDAAALCSDLCSDPLTRRNSVSGCSAAAAQLLSKRLLNTATLAL
jgi:hypothetical protein